MENVVKITNAGALPVENLPEEPIAEIETTGEVKPEEPHNEAEIFEEVSIENSDKPIEHVRSPELRRRGSKLIMTFAAAVGAAAAARLALTDSAALQAVSQSFSGTFGAIFLRQTAFGAVFLSAELLLGFFALGDFLVWALPFLCASGTVLRLFANGSPKPIAGSVICVGAVIFGAAFSAEMSSLLMRLSRGGTVHLGESPRAAFSFKILGCFAAVLLGAILTAALSS